MRSSPVWADHLFKYTTSYEYNQICMLKPTHGRRFAQRPLLRNAPAEIVSELSIYLARSSNSKTRLECINTILTGHHQ
jgi:hypothetical protein